MSMLTAQSIVSPFGGTPNEDIPVLQTVCEAMLE